jgi:hypothetical protein
MPKDAQQRLIHNLVGKQTDAGAGISSFAPQQPVAKL